MCSVWTPLKQPPHPCEVCTLSSDAKKVLETLREAYHRKLQGQLEKQQAKTGTHPQHYRNLVTSTQTSQHDAIATGQHQLKGEPPPPPAPPQCDEEETGTQDDNTTVLVLSQRQDFPQLRNNNDEALREDVRDVTDLWVDTPNKNIENTKDLRHVRSGSVSSKSVADRDVKLSSRCVSDTCSSPSWTADVVAQVRGTIGEVEIKVLNVDQRNKLADLPVHTAEVCQRSSVCGEDGSSCGTVKEWDDNTVRTHNDKTTPNKASDSGSEVQQTHKVVRSSTQVCFVGKTHRPTETEHSHTAPHLPLVMDERDCLLSHPASIFRPLHTDQTVNLSGSSTICKLPSGSETDERPRKRSGDLANDHGTASKNSAVCKKKKIANSNSCLNSEVTSSRKRTHKSSELQASSSNQRGHSSFKTPYRASCNSHESNNASSSDQQKMLKSVSSSTSSDSPFVNLSDMGEPQQRLLRQKLERATEVAMTLLYTDKSSQLREVAQTKPCRDIAKLDFKNSTETIAAYITYCQANSSTGRNGSNEGSSEDAEQYCYVLFPLDKNARNNQWVRDVLLSLMESKMRKICFDAQEMMHTIITQYSIDPYSVCCKWQSLDPKVAGWLLDPDNPPITFSDVVKMVRRKDQQTVIKADSTVKANLLLCNDLRKLSSTMKSLYQKLQEKQLWDLFLRVEMKLCPILAAMEVQGIRVNVKILKEYGRRLRERIDQLEDKAHTAAGHNFQVSSHVQLRQVLFDQLKLDKELQGQRLARTNVQNLKSTSEAVLVKLQDLHPLPRIVLEYRQLLKLNSTYVDGLLKFVSNGFIHTSWEQTSASTGRVQSASPNIQNIPKQPILVKVGPGTDKKDDGAFTIWAREPFVSQEGWSFIAADFQSIELRLLAHMSGDPVLLKVFNNKECPDVFVELASEWLGMTQSDVTTGDREKTKRIVYSVIYGVGSEKLAETLAVSKDEAKAFMKSFLNKFISVSSFSHNCISSCKRHHGAIRTLFNRLRLVPNINSSNFHDRSYAERQAVNFVLQGSAVDICKIAMIQVMHELSTKPHLQARLVVQIHDELLLEAPDQQVEEVKGLFITIAQKIK